MIVCFICFSKLIFLGSSINQADVHAVRCYCTKDRKADHTECRGGYRATGTLTHRWWGWEMVQPCWKTFCWFLRKLNIILPYDQAIALLGIYLKRIENLRLHKKTCTRMCRAALVIIPKTWEQSRCPSAGEWINKLQSFQIMDYCSLLKKNEP